MDITCGGKNMSKDTKEEYLGVHGSQSTDFLVKLKLGRNIENRL